ncbi:hypothetical protein JAAARDRAFT_51235 [Jaapia argillacea MUCL 33604]|uniref:YEATS domain-containing protein n=1 Tax=Jaapia argillacea MUCL 33604 TaxID=933084 RepID=A0A067P9L5_9AGAM|nr:hypothetical protein JAAARDRAFT_51235 [Jaapia argillacea MUCL 33604]
MENIEPSRKRKRKDETSEFESDSELSVDEEETAPFHVTKKQLILEEIDLEIGLRERLAATVNSQITWALILQEALLKDLPAGQDTGGRYAAAAMEALEAVRAPSSFMFSSPTQPSTPTPIPTPQCQADVANSTAPVTSTSASLEPRRNARARAPPRTLIPPKLKLLFIRHTPTATSPSPSTPIIAKLACPDCSRTDFPTLQGIFNHCRLRHKRDWGSHEECIKHCAVIIPEHEEKERDWVVGNGTEVGGVSLPSLRRLFELAVGGGGEEGLIPIPTAIHEPGNLASGAEKVTISTATEDVGVKKEEEKETNESVYLTRTLGHHKDTPALAPFLGRQTKRRCINVHDQDLEVDITGDDGDFNIVATDRKPAWRMSYGQRNVARPELDVVAEAPKPLVSRELSTELHPTPRNSPLNQSTGTAPPQPSIINTATSRFHIVARVSIKDQSLWLPSGRRSTANPEHTHRWMISVTSPSYSLNITTILKKMTITCISDPPPSTLATPISVTDPPFSVMSTSEKPFLAKIKLEWCGDQPGMEVEHWVELDQCKMATPQLGDEQLLDVELDRNIELLPLRDDTRVITWEGEERNIVANNPSSSSQEEEAVPGYVKILRDLLPRFPMTMKGASVTEKSGSFQDVKGRVHPQVAYQLVSNPTYLRNLVPGRRKAIEWGRSRALRDAYEQAVLNSSLVNSDTIPLTTVDVFHWLEEENLLCRPSVPKQSNNNGSATSTNTRAKNITPSSSSTLDAFCPTCGWTYRHHFPPAQGGTEIKAELPHDSLPLPCPAVGRHVERMPLLSVGKLLSAQQNFDQPYGLSSVIFLPRMMSIPNTIDFQPSSLVEVSDPGMVIAIQHVIHRLLPPHALDDAPTSERPHKIRHIPTLTTGQAKADLEAALAPSALLSLTLKPLIRLLLRGGVNALRQDPLIPRPPERRSRNTVKPQKCRLLTPSHLLRGLIDSASHDQVSAAMFLSFGRFGREVDSEMGGRVSGYGEGEEPSRLAEGFSSLGRIKCEE